jgi:hypothetical protein
LCVSENPNLDMASILFKDGSTVYERQAKGTLNFITY